MSFYEFVRSLKSKNPNSIIFVRCGAFFTCIGEDAIIAENVLGLKRTCFSKQKCKCGIPAIYTENNLEQLENKLKKAEYRIIIYNEMEEGTIEFNDKKYGLLWEHKGYAIISEKRKCLNCLECNSNTYDNKNQILKLKAEIESLSKEVNKFIEEYENKRRDKANHYHQD